MLDTATNTQFLEEKDKKEFIFLEEYEDFLEYSEIIWEWHYGVVVDWWFEKIYKIWKNEEYSRELRWEYEKHFEFYNALQSIKNESSENMYKNFRIPEVAKKPISIIWKYSQDTLFVYEMEKIEWNNLLSYLIVDTLLNMWIEVDIRDYTDIQLEKLYKKHTWKDIDGLRNWLWVELSMEERKFMKSITKWAKKWVWEPFASVMFSRYFKDLYPQISEIIANLKKKWYKHTDLHLKNIMISHENWEPMVYMIDFWIAEIPK